MSKTVATPISSHGLGQLLKGEGLNGVPADALAALRTDMVELAGPLADICAALTTASPFAERFDIVRTIDGDCLVRRDWLAPIGLIVGEAVTNAIKHAHPAGVRGVITVVGKPGDGGASVIDIVDDGVGLPDGVDEATFGGHGVALMRRLSQNIGASLRFTSTALGLRVRLRAPATQAERRADEAAAGHSPAKLGEALGARLAKAGQQDYRDLLNALPTALYTTDAQGRITFYNKAAVELWGMRPKLGDEWCGSWRLFTAAGEPMAHGECPMAIAIKENRAIRGAEAIAERPDGARVPFMAYPTPIRDASGALVGAVNSLIDISERKRAEDRQRLMAREIHHRTKNLLSVVYSIVSRGMDGGRSVADTRASVLGRLRALGATYDNLITTAWAGVELSDIVRTELAPYPAQWRIDGPGLVLSPQAAQNFTLAVHELATNAAKYGALSTPEGQVSVDWSIEGGDGAERFCFVWRERGGPPVTPRARQGFGSVVLERVITQDFNSPPRLEFSPDGLTYALDVSLRAVAANPEPNEFADELMAIEALDQSLMASGK